MPSPSTLTLPNVSATSAKVSKAKVRIDEWLLVLFVALLPCMWPLGTWLLGSYIYVADAAFVAACTAWLARILLGKVKVRRGWFYLPITVYLAASVASAIGSIDRQCEYAKTPA